MFVRRRPLLRAAVVGGGAYVAGRHMANKANEQAAYQAQQDDRISQLEQQQVDPASAAAMIKVDRENGLVLISELLKRCPEKLPTLAKNTFSRILDMGGKLVLGDRRESQ